MTTIGHVLKSANEPSYHGCLGMNDQMLKELKVVVERALIDQQAAAAKKQPKESNQLHSTHPKSSWLRKAS